MKVFAVQFYSKAVGDLQLSKTAFRRVEDLHSELRNKGFVEAGNGIWDSEKFIARERELEVI